jgi:hypothetical protein
VFTVLDGRDNDSPSKGMEGGTRAAC